MTALDFNATIAWSLSLNYVAPFAAGQKFGDGVYPELYGHSKLAVNFLHGDIHVSQLTKIPFLDWTPKTMMSLNIKIISQKR